MMLLQSILVFTVFNLVNGHGRLMDPPSRNAMWRYGYYNPVDYLDNEVWCGGFEVQYEKNGGNCGVCGDPWNEMSPRKHENGGFFGNGVLGRRYSPGQVIDVEVELTSNHKGYFEFRLCPLSSSAVEQQECFDKYLLYIEDQSSTRYYIPDNTVKHEIFNLRVKLPAGVSCNQCVIQWLHYTNQTVGQCNDGTMAKGCGNQETYINCADVAIGTNTGSFAPGIYVPPPHQSYILFNPIKKISYLKFNESTRLVEEHNLVVRSQACVARGTYNRDQKQYFDSWCTVNCLKYPPTCPDSICQCLTDCTPMGDFEKQESAGDFCHHNCLRSPQNESCGKLCKCS